jgi:hypothetical protein
MCLNLLKIKKMIQNRIKYIKVNYIFYTMELNLRPNSRYLFQTKEKTIINNFRATVIDVLCNDTNKYKTLRVKNLVYKNGDKLVSTMVTIPYDWIEKAETLEDILGEKIKDVILPTDILLEIDTLY